MMNGHEPVKPIDLDSKSSDPEMELNLVESSSGEKNVVGGKRSEFSSDFDGQDENIKITNLKRASTDVKCLIKKPKKLGQPEKKQLFQRLWSEADEIAILKGMIDYAAIKKIAPVADLNAFRDFMKKDVHFEFSGSQLKNKIMKLRMKYKNNKSKEIKKGKRRTFSNPHKQEAYELSEKIWNSEGKVLGGSWSKKNKENKKGGKTAQWKSLKIKEIEAYMAQLEAKIAEVKMVLDHLKTTV